MKNFLKITAIAIALLISGITWAQDDGYFEQKQGSNTEKGFYKDGKKQGTWVRESKNGKFCLYR